jgi:hypothetical protein
MRLHGSVIGGRERALYSRERAPPSPWAVFEPVGCTNTIQLQIRPFERATEFVHPCWVPKLASCLQIVDFPRRVPSFRTPHGAVGGRVLRSLPSAPEDRELLAQNHDLELPLTPAAREHAHQATEEPIQQRGQHDDP